jgi:hypothetical protein
MRAMRGQHLINKQCEPMQGRIWSTELHLHAHARACACVRVRACACVRACTYVRVCVRVRMCVCVRAHTYLCALSVCTAVYIHACMRFVLV